MATIASNLRLDREFAAAMAAMAETGASLPHLPPGDVDGRRKAFQDMFGKLRSMIPPMPQITEKEHEIPTPDGTLITLTEFRPPVDASAASSNGLQPAVYHIHGGGMILGSVKEFSAGVKMRTLSAGVPLFSIEYRLAPQHPHPTLVNDCYAGLEWLHSHAAELGIDSSRIMIYGDSAGGGLAAGTALMARDRGLSPPLAFQMLIYPMIDDRTLTPNPAIEPHALWRTDDNITGWTALLGKAAGSEEDNVEGHAYAAPARVKSVVGLPPTYIDVGQLDIFGAEDITYASRLMAAGIPVEFHLYPGLPHAFEMVGAQTAIVKSAMANRQRMFDEFKRTGAKPQ